jgi:hypothetical protein
MSALACSRHLNFRCPKASKHDTTYRDEFAPVGGERAQGLYAGLGEVAFLTRAGAWRIARNELTMTPLLQPQLSISSKLIARVNDSSRVVSEFVRALKGKLDSPRRVRLDLPLPMKAS